MRQAPRGRGGESGRGGSWRQRTGAEMRRKPKGGVREGRNGEKSAQLGGIPALYLCGCLSPSSWFSWQLPSSLAVSLSSPFSVSISLPLSPSSLSFLLSVTPCLLVCLAPFRSVCPAPCPQALCARVSHTCTCACALTPSPSLELLLLGERIIEEATLPFILNWTKAGAPAVQPQEVAFKVTIKER